MKKSDNQSQKKEPDHGEGADEWKNKYLRALADYQNLEKRIAANRQDERAHAAEKIIRDLLPVTDVLARAAQHIGDEGLRLAVKELWKVLEREGVSRIEAEGREFDPYEMEAVEAVEGQDNKVIEVLIPGYRLHDRILRVAKVKVGKKMSKES